jgi:general stress protein YciG
MDKTFINKHKLGIVALLFFILLVSQKKSLRFLIHTILGRLILIFLLLGISSFSIIFGIIAVLLIIIMTNKDDSFYLEAFNPEKDDDLEKIKKGLEDKQNQHDMIKYTSLSTSNMQGFIGGREGFNTNERERTMQLGKKSNEVSVGNANQNTENVQPSDSTLSSTPSHV